MFFSSLQRFNSFDLFFETPTVRVHNRENRLVDERSSSTDTNPLDRFLHPFVDIVRVRPVIPLWTTCQCVKFCSDNFHRENSPIVAQKSLHAQKSLVFSKFPRNGLIVRKEIMCLMWEDRIVQNLPWSAVSVRSISLMDRWRRLTVHRRNIT